MPREARIRQLIQGKSFTCRTKEQFRLIQRKTGKDRQVIRPDGDAYLDQPRIALEPPGGLERRKPILPPDGTKR